MSDDLYAEKETEAEDAEAEGSEPEADEAGFAALVEYLKNHRGFDFGGYKKMSLSRRMRRRMQTLAVPTYDAYVDYLEVHPDEFLQLFNSILINVTAFFRDDAAWKALAQRLERVVSARPAGSPIRVWCAGCATGEEAYGLAIVLAELLGLEDYAKRVKIYATDVDDDALNVARAATYSAEVVQAVPDELLAKYFVPQSSSFVVGKELRRAVIFGRHDLVQDAPISRIDLLSCRNTLMYFNAETQTRVLTRLHFALASDGILFLGKAEMLLMHTSLFVPIDLKLRLFARVNRPRASAAVADLRPMAQPPQGDGVLNRLMRATFDDSSVAQLVLDDAEKTTLVNRRATAMFGLSAQDLGRPFHDLELSYRPVELRSLIEQVKHERRPLRLKDIERPLLSGERGFIDVEIVPLLGEIESGPLAGVQLSFSDSTAFNRLQTQLKKVTMELDAAHEELQSTGEELETTNEELQSTVEELETTNEELQSTNEELETMNEELQSTNEELQTMNEELRQQGEELHVANGFLGTILASLRCGLAVLDGDLIIKAWSEKMEDFWGLRADEVVGSHFLNLDIGMPLDILRADIRACLAAPDAHSMEQVMQCTNRRGRPISCRVTLRAMQSDARRGVIVIVEEI